MNLKIQVSVGELLDKITILEIKTRKFRNQEKLNHARKELSILQKEFIRLKSKMKTDIRRIELLKKKLAFTNLKLWNIENKIRKLESSHVFNHEFISLARKVYLTNDIRSQIKLEINNIAGSEIEEVKEYSNY